MTYRSMVHSDVCAKLHIFAAVSASMGLVDRRGHAIMFSAPVELKREVEVWGEAPPTTSLMRGVKHQFDPNQLLNPGRFLGGF